MSRLMELFTPTSRFGEDFDQLIERAFPVSLGAFGQGGYPALNAWEQQEKVFVEAELPGVLPADLDVSVAGAELTINGQRTAPDAKQGTWARRERAAGRFTRTVTLPWDIDADSVEAKLREGVLLLALKKSAQCSPKKITVQSA